MSAFPLTRRAALPPSGLLRLPALDETPAALAQRRSAFPRHQGGCFADPGQHGRSDRGVGGGRRFPARSPSRSRPIWRPATAAGRRWWRGSTISTWGPAAAARASFDQSQDTIVGSLLLTAPRGGESRTCRCGRSPPITRWPSIRRWSSGLCRAAWSPLRRCSPDGRRGSWVFRAVCVSRVIARHPLPRASRSHARSVASRRTLQRALITVRTGLSFETRRLRRRSLRHEAGGEGGYVDQRHDSPRRSRRPWRIRPFADGRCL